MSGVTPSSCKGPVWPRKVVVGGIRTKRGGSFPGGVWGVPWGLGPGCVHCVLWCREGGGQSQSGRSMTPAQGPKGLGETA